MFDVDECARCGICLKSCPVIELNIDQAKQEIENLIAGSSFVVSECATCGTCDLNCPNDLTPMELIRTLKYAQIKELNENGKISTRAKFLFPFNKPNVFEFYQQFLMTPKEAKNLEKWKNPSKSEELVLLGCSISYILQHFFANPTFEQLFQGKSIAGGLDFCCGEVYYRTCFPLSDNTLEDRLHSRLSNLGAKKLILFCNECYEAYKHEYNKISEDFEIISIWEYIYTAIENQDLKITNKLDLKVAFHDACVVKKYPELLEYPRKIVDATGCEIIELEHNHENALCCGLSLGLIDKTLIDRTRKKRIEEFKKAGSEYLVTTCPGCISTFSIDRVIQAKDYKVLSVLELLRMACGEEIDFFKNRKQNMSIVIKSKELAGKRKSNNEK
ncbi:MAG: (Fe-S)-binding protein [Promethearchaeota archaeon]